MSDWEKLKTGYMCPVCKVGYELTYCEEWFCNECNYFNNCGPLGEKEND